MQLFLKEEETHGNLQVGERSFTLAPQKPTQVIDFFFKIAWTWYSLTVAHGGGYYQDLYLSPRDRQVTPAQPSSWPPGPQDGPEHRLLCLEAGDRLVGGGLSHPTAYRRLFELVPGQGRPAPPTISSPANIGTKRLGASFMEKKYFAIMNQPESALLQLNLNRSTLSLGLKADLVVPFAVSYPDIYLRSSRAPGGRHQASAVGKGHRRH
jgi:hypothetical protein